MKYPRLIVCTTLLFFNFCQLQAFAKEATVKDGKRVAFDYTLKVDGEVIDTSAGKKPLEITQGAGEIIPGLEKELSGMKIGEEKQIRVIPVDAYGEINAAAFRVVPLRELPTGVMPEVGMQLQGKQKDGRIFKARISKVQGDTVVLDFNHPLAGKILVFDVKIVSIK